MLILVGIIDMNAYPGWNYFGCYFLEQRNQFKNMWVIETLFDVYDS